MGGIDRLIDVILDIVPVSVARKAIRIAGGVFLLIVCVSLSVTAYNRLSMQKEQRRWAETSAVVTASKTTDVSLSGLMSRYSGGSRSHRLWYKVCTVRYAITAEGDAWGGPYTFDFTDAYAFEVSQYAVEPPANASTGVAEEGGVISIVYNTEEIGSFKVGALEDVLAQEKTAGSGLRVPIVFLALIFALILLDIHLKVRL